MKRTELLQEIRLMQFEEAYGGWTRGCLTQREAASLLGVCNRTFRRYLGRGVDFHRILTRGFHLKLTRCLCS